MGDAAVNPGIGAYRIEPLSGSENYVNWSLQMQVILMDMHLWEYVSGENTCPIPSTNPAPPPITSVSSAPPADPATDTPGVRMHVTDRSDTGISISDQIKKWQKNDQQAKGAIILRLRPAMVSHVRWAKTSKEAWDELSKQANNDSDWSITVLRRKFNRTSFADGQPMDEQISNLKKTYDQLRMMGQEIPDTELANNIIQSLPDSWDNFSSAYMGQAGLKVSSSEVINRIKLEEERRNKTQGNGSAGNQSLSAKKKSKWRPGIRCHKCNKEGHFASECRGGKSSKKKSSKKDKSSNGSSNERTEVTYELLSNIHSFPCTSDRVPLISITKRCLRAWSERECSPEVSPEYFVR